jgi:hypothetical protein
MNEASPDNRVRFLEHRFLVGGRKGRTLPRAWTVRGDLGVSENAAKTIRDSRNQGFGRKVTLRGRRIRWRKAGLRLSPIDARTQRLQLLLGTWKQFIAQRVARTNVAREASSGPGY